MPQGHLKHPLAVAVCELSNCLLVARLQAPDELPVVGPVHGIGVLYPLEHRPIRSYSRSPTMAADLQAGRGRAKYNRLVLAAILVVTALILVNAVYVAAEF